jgi:hypothetical protein
MCTANGKVNTGYLFTIQFTTTHLHIFCPFLGVRLQNPNDKKVIVDFMFYMYESHDMET